MKEFKTLGPTQFGIGDGSQTRFSVARQGDVISSAHVESVITVGWQGEQLLSPTPRTNLLLASNDFESLAWRGSPSLYDDFSLGPPLDPRFTFSRPSPSSYIEDGVLKFAAPNEPVFEDGALRLRPQETNLLWPSEDFSGTGWSRIRCAVEAASTLNGWPLQKMTGTEDNASGMYIQSAAHQISGTKATVSATIYQDTGVGWACVFLSDSGTSNGVRGWVNLATGEAGTVNTFGTGFSNPVVKVKRLFSGAVRVDLTATTPTDALLRGQVRPRVPGNGQLEVAIGDVGYVSCVSLNAGDPIPYIPTTSSQVTRPADNASIQGAAFAEIWDPQEGAIVWEFVRQPPYSTTSSALGAYGVNGGTDRIALFADWYSSMSDNRCGFQIVTNGQTISGLPSDLPALSVGEKHCMAIAFDQGSVSCALDGQIVGSNIPLPYGLPDVTRLSGVSAIGVYNSIPPELHRRLSIFNRRPTDAEMEALTSA